MDSATSVNIGSTTTSHTSNTAVKLGRDIKGGNNIKDSESEGEGAEEVCKKKKKKETYVIANW